MQEKLVGLPVALMPAMPLWWQRWRQSKNSGHNEGTQHSHGLIVGPKLFHSVEKLMDIQEISGQRNHREQYASRISTSCGSRWWWGRWRWWLSSELLWKGKCYWCSIDSISISIASGSSTTIFRYIFVWGRNLFWRVTCSFQTLSFPPLYLVGVDQLWCVESASYQTRNVSPKYP